MKVLVNQSLVMIITLGLATLAFGQTSTLTLAQATGVAKKAKVCVSHSTSLYGRPIWISCDGANEAYLPDELTNSGLGYAGSLSSQNIFFVKLGFRIVQCQLQAVSGSEANTVCIYSK